MIQDPSPSFQMAGIQSRGGGSPGRGGQGPSAGSGHGGRPGGGSGGGHYRPPANGGHGGHSGGHSGGRYNGHSGRHYGGYYRPYYGSYSPYWGWGGGYYWGLGGYWPGWWGYGYPYYGPSVVVMGGGGGTAGGGAAALDLDVSPERAAVYIDGAYVGVCDDYDGFPDYLWLRPGTYDLVLYLQGHVTIARQISVSAGEMLDISDRMEPGEAVRPEDLVSKSTMRKDDRLRRDRERQEEAAAWAEEPSPDEPREPVAPRALDARGEPGRLQLEVDPADASIYLDGRFLGTGEELGRLHSGLLVDRGKHWLQIVRPGYRSVERTFEAEAGDEVELDVKLEKE